MPNTISGRVVLKETGAGIPDLLVVMYDVDSNGFADDAFGLTPIGAIAANPRTAGERLGSVLTDSDGRFELTYEDTEFQIRIPQEARPDLLLMVLAPEEPGVEPEAEPLYVAPSVRRNAGRTEQVLIRLTLGRLADAGICVPQPDATPQNGDRPTFDAQMRGALTAALHADARGSIEQERFVPLGGSVFARTDTLIRYALEGGFHPGAALPRSTHESEGALFELRIAFEHLWQTTVDDTLLTRAEEVYDAIVSFGGDPDRAEWRNLHPVQALTREVRSVLRRRDVPPGDAASLRALVGELEGQLHRKCAFTYFAANARERSVNLGVLQITQARAAAPSAARSRRPVRGSDADWHRSPSTFRAVMVPPASAVGPVVPVVLVAQEMPGPHEVDEHWFAAHEPVLRRAWLDPAAIDDLPRQLAHIRQNIVHYMQAIWAFELPDDRYMRLHAVLIPTFTRDEPPSESLTYTALGASADLDVLVGFMGNYMVFPLRSGNVITDAIAATLPPHDPSAATLTPPAETPPARRKRAV